MAEVTSHFQSGEFAAVIAIVIAASISAFAISFLLIRIGLVALRPIINGWKGRIESKEGVFFHTQLGSYAACLLVANLLSSFAGLMEIGWVAQGGITEGSECNAQGTLIQIGDAAGAYFTSAIAIHTFNTLVLKKRAPIWFTATVHSIGWVIAIIMGTVVTLAIKTDEESFYASVGLWCWIRGEYPYLQFLLHYLPMFLAATISAVLFAIIFLCLRGTLVIAGGVRLSLVPRSLHGWGNDSEQYRQFLGAIARSMLWYPFAYIVLLAPISATRLMSISGMKISFEAFAGAAVCSSLLGLANVIIISNTVRVLGPAFSATTIRSPDIESFYVPESRSPMDEKPPTRQIARGFPSPSLKPASPSPFTDANRVPYPGPNSSTSSRSVSPRTIPRVQPPSLNRSRSSSTSNSSVGPRPFTTDVSSNDRAVTAAGLQQRIIPTDMLNNYDSISRPDPVVRRGDSVRFGHAQSNSTSSVDSLGLSPAPRRLRSGVERMPSVDTMRQSSTNFTLSPIYSSPPNSAELVNVNLHPPTPKSSSHAPSPRREHPPVVPTHMASLDSYKPRPRRSLDTIQEGALQNSRTLPTRRSLESNRAIRPSLVLPPRAPPPTLLPPTSPSSSSAYSSSLSASPSSSFLGDLTQESDTDKRDTLHNQVRARTKTMLTNPGLSSLAWASLVTNAALGDGSSFSSSMHDSEAGSRSSAESNLHRDYSVSSIPTSLRPRTPGKKPSWAVDKSAETPKVLSLNGSSVKTMDTVTNDPEATFRPGPKQRKASGGTDGRRSSSDSQWSSNKPGYI